MSEKISKGKEFDRKKKATDLTPEPHPGSANN